MRGLTGRAILASAVLAVLIGSAFGVLVHAIDEQRGSSTEATRAQEVIAEARQLERLVLDLESGQRGFLITGGERFLQPWSVARQTWRRTADAMVDISNGNDGQATRARQIAAAVGSYVNEYSVPLVQAARRNDPSAYTAESLVDGRRRVDALRTEFDGFVNAERRLFAARKEQADTDARQAVIVATLGLVASVLLILLFGGFLVRSVTLPVRRAAGMAGRLAHGDLAARLPETGIREIGSLERDFNTMAASLEHSRDALRALVDEQAALRRVATLVARAVPPEDIFEAVAAEVRALMGGADITGIFRVEPDGTITPVSPQAFADASVDAERMRPGDGTVTAAVIRTGRPTRRDYGGEEDRDVRGAMGAPIVVEGRLWGVMVAAWRTDSEPTPESEQRFAKFTELVAIAIANAESRAELAASRARVVATADETRRRLERDLHDGAQQSLVHTLIALKLARRGFGDAAGPPIEFLDQALEHAERANAELRDLAHGILPATLSRGLEAALDTLAARIRLPVRLDVTTERLPPDVEATAYFIVAEALTNTVKHAGASSARVSAVVHDGALHVEVQDDGAGGARTDAGTGLLGLHDRAAALDGALVVTSPPGDGTTIAVTLPLNRP